MILKWILGLFDPMQWPNLTVGILWVCFWITLSFVVSLTGLVVSLIKMGSKDGDPALIWRAFYCLLLAVGAYLSMYYYVGFSQGWVSQAEGAINILRPWSGPLLRAGGAFAVIDALKDELYYSRSVLFKMFAKGDVDGSQ